MSTIREYADIAVRVVGEADPVAAATVWNAIVDWAAIQELHHEDHELVGVPIETVIA